jgi:hypothetical protein
LEDDPDYSIYTWGMYLGDIAETIAEQYADHFTEGDVAQALGEIRQGILQALSSWDDKIRAAKAAETRRLLAFVAKDDRP